MWDPDNLASASNFNPCAARTAQAVQAAAAISSATAAAAANAFSSAAAATFSSATKIIYKMNDLEAGGLKSIEPKHVEA